MHWVRELSFDFTNRKIENPPVWALDFENIPVRALDFENIPVRALDFWKYQYEHWILQNAPSTSTGSSKWELKRRQTFRDLKIEAGMIAGVSGTIPYPKGEKKYLDERGSGLSLKLRGSENPSRTQTRNKTKSNSRIE